MRMIDGDKLTENAFKNPISYNAFCNLVKRQPTVDAVPRGAYDQVRWERDIALGQLKQLGYELGEKVVPVAHGKWIQFPTHMAYKCSECGRVIQTTDGRRYVSKHYPFCHCGARMDGKDGDGNE